jgi:insulysin
LNKNNGSANAYTGPSNTNFHFSVSSSKLLEALDRFSAFFYCPLFDPSCTTREINAVDSEHRNNLQNDNSRVFNLMKVLSKEGSAWRKFGSGNKETLSRASATIDRETGKSITLDESKPDGGLVGIEMRRRLMDWWKSEYHAERMNLCVIGKGNQSCSL